jgi:peptidyl-prolyl cis-trans isomerase A (cyclophilin A)
MKILLNSIFPQSFGAKNAHKSDKFGCRGPNHVPRAMEIRRHRANHAGLSLLDTVIVLCVSVSLWLISPSQSALARRHEARLPALSASTLPVQQGAAREPDRADQKTPAAEKNPQAVTPQRDPGLYMTFETTLGNITCKLYENEAPITVRTIVGLALGKQSYLDPRTKQKVAGKRFYDGLTFHRVIPEFMIQGGDPLGNGTGGPEGPGFPFQDEFVPALRFDVPGRLAMANAGPRTNASQFFITEVPTTSLNNRHTIFGQCGNLDVVKAIARVPTRQDRPINAVIMKRVVVERVGAAPPNAPEAMPAVKKAPGPVKKSSKKP